jgi:hypothetical protein
MRRIRRQRWMVLLVVFALAIVGLPISAGAAEEPGPTTADPPSSVPASDLPEVVSEPMEEYGPGPSAGEQPVEAPATLENGGLWALDGEAAPGVGADGEVIGLRDEFSRTYVTEEFGVYRTASFAEPIHFQAPDGSWVPIDLSLEVQEGSRGEAAVLSPRESAISVSIADNAAAGSWVRVPAGAGRAVSWSLRGASEILRSGRLRRLGRWSGWQPLMRQRRRACLVT